LFNFLASEVHLLPQLNDFFFELVDGGLKAERLLGAERGVRLASDGSARHTDRSDRAEAIASGSVRSNGPAIA